MSTSFSYSQKFQFKAEKTEDIKRIWGEQNDLRLVQLILLGSGNSNILQLLEGKAKT
jgi:hypothetical protein